jgi:branched-chain amino acid transport system ATP-binding protein
MSLSVEDVVVRFGGVTAVDRVNLILEPGRIVSVIGPNGSGKSTVFNAISGLVEMQAGSIAIDGIDIVPMNATARVQAGLARTFQTPRFDPQIDVRAAVICGFYPKLRSSLLPSMLRTTATQRDEKEVSREYESISRSMGLFDLSDISLGELPMGQIRLVEVARAIAAKPRYLLLDEPAAGLSSAEQEILAFTIRRMASDGIGVLLVEHNFELVKNLAEHVVVLNRGKLLTEGPPDRVAKDPQVITIYLGGESYRAA